MKHKQHTNEISKNIPYRTYNLLFIKLFSYMYFLCLDIYININIVNHLTPFSYIYILMNENVNNFNMFIIMIKKKKERKKKKKGLWIHSLIRFIHSFFFFFSSLLFICPLIITLTY